MRWNVGGIKFADRVVKSNQERSLLAKEIDICKSFLTTRKILRFVLEFFMLQVMIDDPEMLYIFHT